MSLKKYIEVNFMKDEMFNLIHDYVNENMITDKDADFIEFLGYDFEEFIIEEDITVEDLLLSDSFWEG